MPAAVTFATKPKLGAAMLERALDAGVPCAWVAGDSVYGADRALRRRIEARGGLGYVLAVTSGQRLGARRVDAWAAGVPPEGWQRLSAGEGAKGPRLYDWAYTPYRGGAPAGWEKGLLVRRKLDEPDELAFYLTLAPEGTDLADAGAGGGDALDDRGLLRGRQGRGRAGRVRGPLLDRLAPARHARHAGPRLPRRGPRGGGRGDRRRSTWPRSCCR